VNAILLLLLILILILLLIFLRHRVSGLGLRSRLRLRVAEGGRREATRLLPIHPAVGNGAGADCALRGGLCFVRRFGSLRVAVNLAGDNAFLGIAAVGATFVILSGGIDLSVGAVVAFTSIFIASLVERHGMNPFAAMTLALIVGAAFGTGMGCLIQWFELPPFLVTLAGMFSGAWCRLYG